MNLVTRYRFWKMNRAARPSGDFVKRLDSVILAKAGIQPKKNWLTTQAFRMSFGTLAIVCSMGAGTVSYAYASDDVTPDNPLYPVRQAVETVQEATAPTPAIKQAVIQQHLERRVQEIEVMKKRLPEVQKNEEAAKVLDRVESALKQGIQQKETPRQVNERVKVELDKTDQSQLRPMQRQRVDNVRSRIERALKLQKRR